MRVTSGITVATVLLLLLSGFSLLGMDPEASRYDSALVAMDRLALTEDALRQNILSARAGLLRNYDPLNQERTALHAALDQLREAQVDKAVLAPLADLIREQDDLTERFKSDNALLHNSLAYFGLLSSRFGARQQDGSLNSGVTALVTAMLHLTFDMSPASAQEVEDGLDRLVAQGASTDDGDLVNGLLAHGRLIHDLLPATDRVVRSLYDLQRTHRIGAVRTNILEHQKASRARARRYRLLLYATSLLLLILLVNFGQQLRRHVLGLRRRATFEHAIAAISMGFIDAESSETGHNVEQALAKLADWGGADRAYFVVSTVPFQLYSWSRDSGRWPEGWPTRALALAARIEPDANGLVRVPSVADLPDGANKEALTAAGLHSWVCIPAAGQDGNGSLLGFDAFHAPMTWPASELGLLRMAVNTVANAAGRAQLQRERARLEARQQQARRMETIGALTSGIAHNFNNIIGAILGHTEMLEGQVAIGSRLARNVEGARQAAERARDLIDQILTFGRHREARRQQVSLRALMTETASLLFASLPAGANLVIGDVPEKAFVYGDFAQLQQVIINICNNAVQSTDGVSTVEVMTDVSAIAAPVRLSHGRLYPGRYVRIAVRDEGCGMDAVTLERLFEPFFTTRQEGNGLGLATVHEIVSDHGGAIDVRSRPGQGSVFEVWIPHTEAEPATVANRMVPVQGTGETVLLVDDDRERLLRTEEIVAALGYEPVGFAEPDQALAACRTTPQRFDALLIGHLVPITAALAFVKALREATPMLPILLAASASEIGVDCLATAGVSEVVGKPLVSVELASALSRCLST